ncbi:MAG: tetratricopeptide repeat protein [Cyclobacteriaceae bacterium]
MINQPIVRRFPDGLWEFVFPDAIESEDVQDKYWEAIELLDFDPEKSISILSDLVKQFPYFIDAYNHLSIANKNVKRGDESFRIAKEAYEIGRNAFPIEFDHKVHELRWSILDNRQYLRSCHILGLEYQDRKLYGRAIDLYKDILTKNPGDNQGVRYLILECYIHQKDFHKGQQFFKLHSDNSIEFSYGQVLLDIFAGNIVLATENMKYAMKKNKYLPKIVAENGSVIPEEFRLQGEPNFVPPGVPVGSIHEAYEYWKRNKDIFSSKAVNDFFVKMVISGR